MEENDLRIERAKELLEHDLFIEAFDMLENELKNRWEHSGSNEAEARESCWLALQILSQVRQHIESIVTTGRLDELAKKSGPII